MQRHGPLPDRRATTTLVPAGQRRALELVVLGRPAEEALDVLVTTAQRQAGGNPKVALFVTHGEDAHLALAAATGDDEPEIGAPAGIKRAAYTGEPVVVLDVANDWRCGDLADLAGERGIHACWSYPIATSAGGVIGSIELYHFEPRDPAPEDVVWIEELAHTAALILEHSSATEDREKSEQLHQERDALLDMVAFGRPLADCLSALCAAVPRLNPGTRACVHLLDEEGRYFRESIAPDIDDLFRESVKGAPIDRASVGTCAEALHTGKVVTCPETGNDEPWPTPWRDLCLASGIRACHSAPVTDLRNQSVATFVLCFDRPGDPGPWEQRLAALGAQIASLAFARDQGDRALRKSEERYRAVVTATSDVVYRHNADWTEMQKLEGYPFLADTEEPDRDWFSKYILPEDQPEVSNAIQHAIRHKQMFELEHRILRADGTVGWTLSRAIPLLDEDGEVTEWFGTASDVTERRNAEEALRESEVRLRELNRSLEGKVDERTRELQRQTERLRSLTTELTTAEQRERKRLATMLHDDLQQSVVAGKIQLGRCRDRVHDELALEAIATAEGLLEEVMTTSRELTRQLRPAVLYEDGLVAALKGLACDIERRYCLQVTFDASEVIPDLSEDVKVFLFETTRELLTNVAKHAGTEHAGVEVRNEDDFVRLAVHDHGRGFDAEATEGAARSDGFGLFSIRERLAALGGSTHIESAPDRGSRIELHVPVFYAEKGPAAVPGSDLEGPELPPKRTNPVTPCTELLVVDDHTAVRQGLAQLLGADERVVVVGQAGNGVEAIEAVSQRTPDVVLMDVNMPQMNGVEATRELRRRWPAIIVIGLSVQEDAGTSEMMRDAGAAGFLPKSGDGQDMIEAIVRLARASG